MFSQIAYIFIFCLILAFLEVQIEGKDGWAKNLPTWRPGDDRWFVKLYRRVTSGKNLTGYHLGINLLVLFSLHGFYFFNSVWTWSSELQVLALFFLIAGVWDFLWFVLNPHYGWKSFKPVYIAWHKSWLGPWPLDYYYAVILFIVLYSLSFWPDWYLGLGDGLALLLGILFLTVIVTFIRIIIDNRKDLIK